MSEVPAGTPVTCGACGSSAAADARFCEGCGAELPAAVPGDPSPGDAAPGGALPAAAEAAEPVLAVPSPSPGRTSCLECGGAVDADGYCTTCGAKAPRARDHLVEQPQPWVGAVSDRGVRHHRNEDAMAVAADGRPGSRAVLVVCDGVSNSLDSDVASLAAARAACEVLVGSRAQGLGTDSAVAAVLGARLAVAADAANRAVARATLPDHGDNPPSCTFVAAVVERGRIVAGVVGDSRAYWLPDSGEARALTIDDSWAAEQIAAGRPREEAESGPQAHAITRWLGVDERGRRPSGLARGVLGRPLELLLTRRRSRRVGALDRRRGGGRATRHRVRPRRLGQQPGWA
jgi:serine/threonine protein phosphatase PrpC